MKQAEIARQIAALRSEIGRVAHRLRADRETKVVPLVTLAPEPYELTRPVSVVIERVDDEFTASLVEANLATVGESEFDAVEALKSLMLDVYESLEASRRGPATERQWVVLRSILTRTRRQNAATNEGLGGADRP